MNTTRRNFLLGATALLAAPAVVRASSLMKLWVPPAPKIVSSAVVQDIQFVATHGAVTVDLNGARPGHVFFVKNTGAHPTIVRRDGQIIGAVLPGMSMVA